MTQFKSSSCPQPTQKVRFTADPHDAQQEQRRRGRGRHEWRRRSRRAAQYHEKRTRAEAGGARRRVERLGRGLSRWRPAQDRLGGSTGEKVPMLHLAARYRTIKRARPVFSEAVSNSRCIFCPRSASMHNVPFGVVPYLSYHTRFGGRTGWEGRKGCKAVAVASVMSSTLFPSKRA